MNLDKSSRVTQAKNATWLAISINFVLALIKGATGYIGNSYALIADAIESLTDVVSSSVVLIGLSVAARPPSEKYPFGRGRAETISGVVVSLFLFLAAVVIVVESIREIITPHHAPAWYTLIVLIGVVVTKELLYRLTKRTSSSTESFALQSDAAHHRSDVLTSLAAFIGISVALILGPGYESADDWAALIAAAIIIFNAFVLMKTAFGELLDHSDPRLVSLVREIARSVPEVFGTHKCRVRKVGFDTYVDLDVLVDGDMSVRDSHRLAHIVQDEIREKLPLVTKVLVHIEPKDDYGWRDKL